VAARDLLVEPLLPVFAAADPGCQVVVEKDSFEADSGDGSLDVRGDALVATSVTDEHRGHCWHSGEAPTQTRDALQSEGNPPTNSGALLSIAQK
jgi:hypothetical protein